VLADCNRKKKQKLRTRLFIGASGGTAGVVTPRRSLDGGGGARGNVAGAKYEPGKRDGPAMGGDAGGRIDCALVGTVVGLVDSPAFVVFRKVERSRGSVFAGR
jgi:hypothetical protein